MSERDRRDVATHRWCRRMWLKHAIDIAQRVRAEIETDAAKAREARLHARDANGYDSVPYHDGRSDGVEQVIRALTEALRRYDDA